MANAELALDADQRTDVIDGLLAKLHEYYVFPDVADRIAQAMRERQANNEYDAIDTASVLCNVLTDHMQQVSDDKHLCLFYSPDELLHRVNVWEDPIWQAEYAERMALYNHGFYKVERLAGNVGYIDLRSFLDPGFASETAIAAMQLVSNTSTLIFDLRRNDGGSPAMIALLSTYLFETQVHLITFYNREDDSMWQSWTLPYVPGARYVDKPVYVLTSRDTISGAEEFAYNLKHHKRATIVGEVTAGAAHPGSKFQINKHFEVIIPTGRAISPITGTDWEGVGVLPDIEVLQQDALEVAYTEALKAVLARMRDSVTGPRKQLADELQQVLRERHDLRGEV